MGWERLATKTYVDAQTHEAALTLIDSDTMVGALATNVASAESIKAYVDAQTETVNSISEILALGSTTTTDQKIQFRDTGLYINSSADGQLDIVADTEIQIAATTIDINGTCDISGQFSLAGTNVTADATELSLLDGITTLSGSNTGDETQATINALDITETGALASGSIASGFTSIDSDYTEAKVHSIVAGDGIDVSAATGDVTVTAENASTSNPGVVELATDGEANTGTDNARAVTPDNLGAWTGNTAITSVGTIGTGEWRGTTVDTSYGGTGVTSIGALKNLLDDETWSFANAVSVPALTVTGNLDVTGTTTTIDSANLAVTDPVIQLSVLADQTNYATVDSAIIFGHSTNANGGKIINDAGTGFKFTELTLQDDVKAGTIVGEGTADVGTYVNAYMKGVVLDEISAPSPVINGMLYFDGTDVFIGTD